MEENTIPLAERIQQIRDSLHREKLEAPKESTPMWMGASSKKAKPSAEEKHLFKEKERENAKKNAWHQIFICGLRIAAVILGIIFIIRMSHMVLPDCFCWLTDTQIQDIEGLLFGGTIGTLFGKQVNNVSGAPKVDK